ncbi:MAG: PA2779 family protein [Deltaproteobacteria bacterium]
MEKFRTSLALKPLALYLAIACFVIASIPKDSLAYLVESQPASYSRGADMDKIQRVLESKMVSQRLQELGLSVDEVNSKLAGLGDAEIHQFASRLDSLMPGGDMLIDIMALLVIAILVLVILHLLGYKVIIK